MTPQFKHECLTETHHFRIGLAARGEVGTALAATHRKRGQRVLERLLESKELQDTQVHRSVETNTALVRTDGVVVLHTVAHVRTDVAFIVHPGHTELVDAVGNAQALHQIHLVKFGVLVVLLFNRTQPPGGIQARSGIVSSNPLIR